MSNASAVAHGGGRCRALPSLCLFWAGLRLGFIARCSSGSFWDPCTFVVMSKLLCATRGGTTGRGVPAPAAASSTCEGGNKASRQRLPPRAIAPVEPEPKSRFAAPAAVETVEKPPRRITTAVVGNSRCTAVLGIPKRTAGQRLLAAFGSEPARPFQDQNPQPRLEGQEELCRGARVPINYGKRPQRRDADRHQKACTCWGTRGRG